MRLCSFEPWPWLFLTHYSNGLAHFIFAGYTHKLSIHVKDYFDGQFRQSTLNSSVWNHNDKPLEFKNSCKLRIWRRRSISLVLKTVHASNCDRCIHGLAHPKQRPYEKLRWMRTTPYQIQDFYRIRFHYVWTDSACTCSHSHRRTLPCCANEVV